MCVCVRQFLSPNSHDFSSLECVCVCFMMIKAKKVDCSKNQIYDYDLISMRDNDGYITKLYVRQSKAH